MAKLKIKPHLRPYLRISIWLLCTAICTGVAVVYGARRAALIPALALVVFVPAVLLPIIKSARRD
jgi:hypothetical protein